jgi:ATP-dependent DNA helicase RecQ
MKAKEREQAQAAFMNDKVDVLVAKTAFGMGVDKPNVRFVFHYDISDSVDSYYQEIGRAGRDAEKSLAILFYNLLFDQVGYKTLGVDIVLQRGLLTRAA